MSIRPGQRPRIFCIGLNKTGTKSLAQAFSMLGLRALHDARRATEAIERAAAQSRPLLTWIDDDDGYLDARFIAGTARSTSSIRAAASS
jgi:hypothetical protein